MLLVLYNDQNVIMQKVWRKRENLDPRGILVAVEFGETLVGKQVL